VDRFVSFIDAGYVYAAGGELVHGTTNRTLLDLDVSALLDVLDRAMRELLPPGVDFLRHYWYDAAIGGVPQAGHLRIADIPGVKVRLGRLTLNGQKGVDSLLVRDMMRLASEHAVCTAFLLSGDEDLRQGVLEAQDSGVKVILIGIQPTKGQNQAETLVREADGRRILTADEVRPLFALRSEPLRDTMHALTPSLDAFEEGRRFGRLWADESDPADVAAVNDGGETTRPTDGRLIRALLTAADLPFGTRLDYGVLTEGRRGFRRGVEEAWAEREGVVPPFGSGDAAPTPVLPQAEPPKAAPPAEPIETPDIVQIAEAIAAGADLELNDAALPSAPTAPQAASEVPSPGAEFARQWAASANARERELVYSQQPVLPQPVDTDLLKHLLARQGLSLGSPVDPEVRKQARRDFFNELAHIAASAPESPAAAEADVPSPYDAGLEFGKQWRSSVPDTECWTVSNLVRNRLGLPPELDRQLLNAGSALFGYPLSQGIRFELRRGFGDAVWD
jgi:hypothetical protein